MQTHLNKCEPAKQKASEATAAFQENMKQGWKPTIEPVWKRRRLDLPGVRRVSQLLFGMLTRVSVTA